MAESHGDATPQPGITPYLVVFGALSVFTLVSFVANELARSEVITPTQSFVTILAIAVVKAILVVLYFMHLLQDWYRVCAMIVPAVVLAAVLVVCLLPDGIYLWHQPLP